MSYHQRDFRGIYLFGQFLLKNAEDCLASLLLKISVKNTNGHCNGEVRNGHEPCTSHVLVMSTSCLKEVMLYLGQLPCNNQNPNAPQTKLTVPTGNSDSQHGPAFLAPQSWGVSVHSSQAMLAGTVVHLTDTKTAALMKAGVMFKSTFTREHLSGWPSSCVAWSSVEKGTFTAQSG